MGDEVRTIVDALNSEPFNKHLTLIGFDGLKPLELLQVLNDVFAEISEEHKIEIKNEDGGPEQTLIRMLGLLRVLKYKPPSNGANASVATFRPALIAGSPEVIYPILAWALPNMKSLKTRAYLARYLKPLPIPTDILQDPNVQETQEKYLQLMEEFKDVHKELDNLENSGMSTQEVKRDIQMMESEKLQLEKRIDRLRKKSQGMQGYSEMLEAARNLRLEEEREEELASARVEQRNQLMHGEDKLIRLQHQLQELRSARIAGGVEGLLSRMEEEVNMNTYLTTEKLPAALAEKEKAKTDLQRVLDQPAMQQSDLDELHKKVQEVTSDCNKLIEKRMVTNDPTEDKLSLFKQQASIISRKKETKAEQLQETQEELETLKSELTKKKSSGAGPKMLKVDEFKRYVAKLRAKSTDFKLKKAELSELRSEYLVLSRTEELLTAQDDSAQALLANMEEKRGVKGHHEIQEELEKVSTMKSELDEKKGQTLDDISQMVEKLTGMIASKKMSLGPMITELKGIRTKYQEVESVYEEKKSNFNNMAAGLESNKSRLEQEVRALREEVINEENRYHYLNSMIAVLEAQKKRVQEELQTYVSSDKTKSYRDMYAKKIQEQETAGKNLRERQKVLQASHEPHLLQQDMWRDLAKLLECKKKSFGRQSDAGFSSSDRMSMDNNDRLVL